MDDGNKFMVLNEQTYGVYYPDSKTFWCTHGAWEGDVELLNDTVCMLFKEDPQEFNYKFIDKIPKGYNFT